jgi:hypothetical protein
MPYIPKGEREQHDWMTLKEAISHIRSVDGCDEAAALQELRVAIADEAIAVRLRDTVPSGYGLETFTFCELDLISALHPVLRRMFWRHVPFDLYGDGYVATVDPEQLGRARRAYNVDRTQPAAMTTCGNGSKTSDVLDVKSWANSFLDRETCTNRILEQRSWTEHDELIPRRLYLDRASILKIWDPSSSEAPLAEDVTRQREVKKPADKTAIRKAAREVYNRGAPNINDAFDEIAEVLRGQFMKASRQRVREVLHEPEFETKRLGPGERPSKK